MFKYLGNKSIAATKYAKEDISKVDGWFGQQQINIINTLNKIQYLDCVNGHFLEIGVHHGRLFCFMQHLLRDGELAFAIDVFDDQYYNVDKSGNGSLSIFKSNLNDYGCGIENTRIIKSDSTKVSRSDLLNLSNNQSFRIIHVDGSHMANCVASDLVLSSSILDPQGIVIIDDYQSSGWPGVSEGTARYMLLDPACSLLPVAIGYGKGVFTTISNQKNLLEKFKEHTDLRAFYIRTHYNHDVAVY